VGTGIVADGAIRADPRVDAQDAARNVARGTSRARACSTAPAYHARVLPPFVIALGLGLALLVLLPAWRLQLAGLDARWIGGYAATVWGLAMLVALFPGTMRFLVPILLIAWVAPFVVAPERLGRVLRRGGRGGGLARNVTPGDGPAPRPPDRP
jgi:hypothetical protein